MILASLQFVNVIVSNIKYVVTIKAKASVAGIVNALSYTISAIIVFYTGSQELYIVIAVAFFSNLIGVPIGKAILGLCSKDKLWIYNSTFKGTLEKVKEIKKQLDSSDIEMVYSEIVSDRIYNLRILSYTKRRVRPYIPCWIRRIYSTI